MKALMAHLDGSEDDVIFGGMDMSTIAETLKALYTDSQGRADQDRLLAACHRHAVETDQDWKNETTTYSFEDGSSIETNGPTVTARV